MKTFLFDLDSIMLTAEGLTKNILAATARMQADTSLGSAFSRLTGNAHQLTQSFYQPFFHESLQFYYL
jgi:hypothetical protein